MQSVGSGPPREMEHRFSGLSCAQCGVLQREGDEGQPCRKCGGMTFASVRPTYDWHLTAMDRLFLHMHRIQP